MRSTASAGAVSSARNTSTLLRREHATAHASYYGVMIWVLVELELWLRGEHLRLPAAGGVQDGSGPQVCGADRARRSHRQAKRDQEKTGEI